MLEWLFLLLPVAAGYGWIMGRNSVRLAQQKQSSILSRHYYKGLNFLLSDQPDKAVDTLIKMMSEDSDSAETHIAMGNFFRHRGEIDRAIRVHQNVLKLTEIDESQRYSALYELAKDYLQAGFLDRAEASFSNLLASEQHTDAARLSLFNIYQTTKDWDKAASLAETALRNEENQDTRIRLANYYCELALKSISSSDYTQAKTLLLRARDTDKLSVRPLLILAGMEVEEKNYHKGLEFLLAISTRDSNWSSEAVPLLLEIVKETNDWSAFEKALAAFNSPCASVQLGQVEVLLHQTSHEAAVNYLVEKLQLHPTMRGFLKLMQLYMVEINDPASKQSLQQLQSLVSVQIEQRPRYRCHNCGFSGRKLHWLCPSCRKWNLVKPIKGLDGE